MAFKSDEQRKAYFARMRERFQKGIQNAKDTLRIGAQTPKALALWGIEKAKKIPVEMYMEGLTDMPFSWAESKIAQNLQQRAERISNFAAKQIGGMSAAASATTGEWARRQHGRILRMTPEQVASERRRVAELLSPRFAELTKVNRKLRTEVRDIKFHQAAWRLINEQLKTGKVDFDISETDIAKMLRAMNEDDTERNRNWLRSLIRAGGRMRQMGTFL